MYVERPARFPGAVLWERRIPAHPERTGTDTDTGDAAQPIRVLPDGCMDLVWAGDRLLVAGPDTTAHLVTARPGTTYAGVRFAPGLAPAVLGLPADLLCDRREPLIGIWAEDRVRRMGERIATAGDAAAALEALAGRLVRQAARPDPLASQIVAQARAGTPIAEIAGVLGLSERQLRRRSLSAFGYPPKTLARILRLNRAVDLAHAGTPFASVAVTTGYADQAHLAREVRALAGVPLGALVTARGPG